MSRDIDRQIAICDFLGLDPAKTTSVWISWDAGSLPTVSWEGRVVLTEEQSRGLGEILQR